MCCNRVGLLVLVLMFTTLAVAQEPRDEPIYIESDSLKIDDIKGISTYQGNVVFRQGPDTLKADKVVIYTEQRKDVKKIVATGKPARFDRYAELLEDRSWGEAEIIEYYADKSLVIFNKEARFQQGDNQFSGNRVEYELDKKLVKAGKNVAGEGRIKMIIHPRSKDEGKPEQE